MKTKYLMILGLLVIVVIVLTYTYFQRPSKGKGKVEVIIQDCISLCESALQHDVDLSVGPCLSDNNPEWKHSDWVCDVAHWPREDVDNNPSNQCKEFREGRAHHFVEVTPECGYIRHR
ncbi:MAG: hypothetical protein J7K98_00230 [Candidatus Aenigmarchaeota archaeon]|nr:hypothetical protein [Candidatus Aenigmarchaeota archaeon]